MREYKRPRFRLAPALAGLEGGGFSAKARPDSREEDGKDGQVDSRVPLVWAIWSSVLVIQVLSKGELGPTAGVNLGAPPTFDFQRRVMEGGRRLVKVGCLETLVSTKESGEPQL